MAEFDYVIVGAGSAGCVLANRLSEDPGKSVALIEAGGGNRSLKVMIPAAFTDQFKTRLDWDFQSEPEPHCDDRSLFIPRGKMLGGSSSMNAMLYVRGCALDYDQWGVPGWSWNNLLPYFLQAENNSRGASEFHGADGPLHVSDAVAPRKLTGRFMAAAEQAGFAHDADYNDGSPSGASIAQVTQRRGRRWSTAEAYLRPALTRANLKLLPRRQVLRLEISGGRATGVRVLNRRGGDETVVAREEVILAAGAIGSPQLLLLSGVGPEEDLRALGIDVAAHAPGVGANLQDHPLTGGIWETTGESLYGADNPRYLAEWLLRRSGPLTSTAAEAFLFTESRTGLQAPDLQFHFAPAYFHNHGFDKFEGHAFTFGPVLVAPKSRGRLSLRSAEPLDKPRILTNTFAEPDDLTAIVEGVKIARRVAQQQPLAELTVGELKPGPGVMSDDELAAYVRQNVELLYHPVGTCRMGIDEDSVVDEQARVRGIEGLRVVDASIIPTIPRGNTNAPTIMVAERAADLIRGKISRAEAAAEAAAQFVESQPVGSGRP